jgi:2-(1,2-epoxy-1,2-dihydrophenyl)acetyl-CoA isomerase
MEETAEVGMAVDAAREGHVDRFSRIVLRPALGAGRSWPLSSPRNAQKEKAPTMEQAIRSERREGYRVITINRPDKMNALDRATALALIGAIDEAEADEACRALMLTGTGRAFCAGADLSGRAGGERRKGDAGTTIEQTWNPLARRLANLRFPSLAAVNGAAAGAGSSLALGCDIVIAARSAYFLQAFARIGLIPDCGGTFFLPRLAGEGRARALAMLAERLPAAQAEAWGMIWKCVDDGALMDEAHAMAARLAAMPGHALVLIRKALRASAHNSFDAQLDLERDYQAEASRTPDHKEGVAAFLEKRTPKFTGSKA